MKTFPILYSNGMSIPYELVKQHERQVMINHCGQSLETIIRKRGGLDWVELYCVLNDKLLDRSISPGFAMYRVLKKVMNFNIESKKDKMSNKVKLRSCEVKLPNDKNDFTVDAYFHRWGNRSKVLEASPLFGGGPGGIVNYIVGIIEYEDGTIDECNPKDIRFTDRG